MSKKITYFGFAENEMNKEKFLRGAYVELYSAIDAPENIDSVQFSDVFVERAELVKFETTYNIDYTMEIGYDREEQYIDKEEYYDKDLKKYLTRNVVKSRTVTDWQPYQGTANELCGKAISYYKDGDSIDIGDKDEDISDSYSNFRIDTETALKGLKSRKATEEEAKDFTVPSESDFDYFASMCATNSNFYQQILHKLPGDKHRNFFANWSAEFMYAAVHAVDRYKLTFDYEGHKCFIKQLATEALPNIYCSYKYTDTVDEGIKEAEQTKLNTDPEFQKKVKLYQTGTLASLGFGLLCAGFSSFLGVFAIIGIIAAVIGFIVSYKVGKKMEAQLKEIKAEYKQKRDAHKKEVQNNKLKLLETRFAKMGFAPLTEEEKERFLLDKNHTLTALYAGPAEEKKKDVE